MTTEVHSRLAPAEVLMEAKRFFTGEDSVAAASLVDESHSHVTLSRFRSRLAVSAVADGEGSRVRVSTLRPDESIGKFLSHIGSAEPETER
ncbi:MAG: hypothetical protein ACE5HF_06495 [Gemmatimonadota bacterium]